jgi:YVTN family beta-propeller protein
VAVALGFAAGFDAHRASAGGAPAGVTVYTVNTDDSTVSVLDGTTLARAHADVPVDTQPQALVVSPDNSRVYTANIATGIEGFSSITTIDTTTNDPLSTYDYDDGSGLQDIAASPDGTTLYTTVIQDGHIDLLVPATSGTGGFDLPNLGESNPDPGAIDILPDGSAVFVLDGANGLVVQMSTSDGSSSANAPVGSEALEVRVSTDGSTVAVVGNDAAQFFSTDTLTALAGEFTTSLGEQVDVAAAGGNFYVLNRSWVLRDLQPVIVPRGVGGGTQPEEGDAAIDIYVAATGAYVKSIDLGSKNVLGIAVLADASKAYVSFIPGKGDGAVVAVDLSTGAVGPSGPTGANPRRVAVRAGAPVMLPTPVVSYFLPRIVNLKVKGADKDSLVASGFYDDGGLGPDYTQPVTVDVGAFEETLTLVPNKKHTKYKGKGTHLQFAIAPNLRGSSRGRFRMRIAKTTLGGLIDPNKPVDFHFHATNLPDAQGEVVLTSGKYKLGKKPGELLSPPFFPARATAVLRGPNQDSLVFKGGFATTGTTPTSLGTVTFAFGDFTQTIPGSSFTKTGNAFKYSSTQGKTKISIVLDFLRETVTLKAKNIEVGDVSGATAQFELDTGAGSGAVSNTVRLGSKTPKKFY